MTKFSISVSRKILLSIFFYITLDLLIGTFYLSSYGDQPFKNRQQNDQKNWNRVYDKNYHHGLVPNSSSKYNWGPYEYEVFVNSLGLRDDSIRQIEYNTDKYRILVLGDSFVEGVGLPHEQTFVGLLNQTLYPHNIEVLNGGVQSYSPKLYYLKTKYLIEKKSVDLDEVIIFVDLSDMQNEVYFYKNFEPDSQNEPAPDPSIKFKYSVADRVTGFLTDHSLLGNMLHTLATNKDQDTTYTYEDVTENWTFDNVLFETYGKEGLELSTTNITRLIELLRQHQISNISLVVYPWPETIRQDSLNSIHVSHWQQFAIDNSIKFINLFPVFFHPDFDQEKFLSDGEHWNAAGHQIVADSISNILGLSTRSAQIQQ